MHNVEEKTPYGTWVTIHNFLWTKVVLKRFFPCFVFMFPCCSGVPMIFPLQSHNVHITFSCCSQVSFPFVLMFP
jgi:hypothetical protein